MAGKKKIKKAENKLSSGRNVIIKEIAIDIIDDLKDIPEIYFIEDGQKTIRNVNKAQTAWIRNGLGGGDFEGWKPNGSITPDDVIRQLSDQERAELVVLIQKGQQMFPIKPSN